MTSGRYLFLLLVCSFAVGILQTCFFEDSFPLSASDYLLMLPLYVAALLFLGVFFFLRRGLLALFALCAFFFTLGCIRTLLPSFALQSSFGMEWGRAGADALSTVLHRARLSPDTTALLEAMLLGRRDGLSDYVLDLYRQSGASHILALSGLHLSVLFGVFNYGLLRVLHRRWRYFVGLLGILFMWGYAFLTGFPISLCRATLMLSLLVIAQMRLVGNEGWHTLGLAAMVLLLLNPLTLFDVGFQLSFAAVAGLLLFYPPLMAIGLPKRRFLRRLWQLFVVALSAQLGVFPLLLHYFHRFSLVGLFFSPFYALIATLFLFVALLLLILSGIGAAFLLRPLLEGLAFIQHGLMAFSLRLSWGGGESVWLLPGSIEHVHFSWGSVLLLYVALLCLLPSLHALQWLRDCPPLHRRALFFRTWPYLLAFLLLTLSAFLMPFIYLCV